MTEHVSNVARCQFVAIPSDLFGHATSRILISDMQCFGGMQMQAILVTEKYAIEIVQLVWLELWVKALFSSYPKTFRPIPLNVWTHAWSIKYR